MRKRPLKVMTVFGTRPEAIKMAPVVKALQAQEEIKTVVAVTAQHREMLDQVLRLFSITPDYDLNIMQAGQTLFDITTRALNGLAEVIQAERPDWVLVHGDTTTTFAASLAAFYFQIPVGHVEAGLRTGNKYSPFPEEMNRRLTGAIADLHFAPTATAAENLEREGVPEKNIFITGNTVIDALLATVRPNYVFNDPLLNSLAPELEKIIVVTTHRRENWGEPLRNIYRALKRVVRENPDVRVVFPVHRNPVVREAAKEILGEEERIHLIDPLDYEPFANLLNISYLVLTDSGGLQEEAPALGKPVLVLRDTTERPEAVAAGTVLLTGTKEEKVYQDCSRLLHDRDFYETMARAVNPYGDGHAAERTVAALLYWEGLRAEPPQPFNPVAKK